MQFLAWAIRPWVRVAEDSGRLVVHTLADEWEKNRIIVLVRQTVRLQGVDGQLSQPIKVGDQPIGRFNEDDALKIWLHVRCWREPHNEPMALQGTKTNCSVRGRGTSTVRPGQRSLQQSFGK